MALQQRDVAGDSSSSGDRVYSWNDARDRAIRAFGTAPSAALEAELLEYFERAPARFVGERDSVAAAFAAGKVYSPWPALASRLRRVASTPDVVVTDASERDRAIERAENLLRAVGPHIELEREVVALLFEDAGERCGPTLGLWAEDEELRERMVSLWRELTRKVAA